MHSKRYLKSLQELHSKYVLVPADKAAQKVIVVCKSGIKEIDTTSTYERVMVESQSIVNEHIKYFNNDHFMYHHNANAYLGFIGFRNFISSLTVQGL